MPIDVLQRNMVTKIGLLLTLYLIQANGRFSSLSNDAGNEYEDQYTISNSLPEIICTSVHLSNFHPTLSFFNVHQYEHKNVYLKISLSYIPTIPSSTFVNVPYNVIKLQLNSIHISEILPGAFNSLTNLEELYLSFNNLTTISDGVFNSLINLIVLDLSRNSIQDISVHAFAGTMKLRTINLSYNALKTFNYEWLTHLPNIESLDLGFNQLQMPKFNITSDTLNYLNLSNNDITEFTGSLPELTSLDLSKNKLISVALSNRNTLAYLDLSYNSLSDLKSENFYIRVSKILYLFLQNNNITSIPNDFFAHLNIRSLNLSCNQLEQFQYGLFDSLHALEDLDISHNKISVFKRFNYHSLVNLLNLYLHDNELSNLDSKDLISTLPELRKLSLNGNNFTCEVLVEIFHNLGFRRIVSGHSFNSSNIHGIPCSDNEDFDFDLISPENSTNTGDLLLSKLNQFFNNGFTRSEMYKYFNGNFKNSNFFKYLEKFKDDSGFKNSFMYSFFYEDFKNSSFYKYLENTKEEMQSNNEYNQRIKNYFQNDFKNSSFVKYLDNVNKGLNSVNDVFSKGSTSMYNYFNSGFKDSNFYKYLEAMKAPQFIIKYTGNGTATKAEKLIGTIPEEKQDAVSAPIVIMLLLLVCIASSLGFLTYLVYFKLNKRNKDEQVELIEA